MSMRKLLAKAGLELLWWRQEHPCCGGRSDALLVEMNAALADVPVDVDLELGGIANDVVLADAVELHGAVLAGLREAYRAGREVSAAVHDARVTELLLANNREVERRRDAETPGRPMETAPRDGTMIKLLMGREQPATVGWWRDDIEITGPRRPWWFIDRQTNPASHFINRAVEHLPIAWGPL